MKVELPKADHFVHRDCIVGGEACLLVFPKAISGIDWDNSNKYFRSSIWRKSDLKPVSLSYKKFTNYGEKPNFEPLNIKYPLDFIRKVDGSCLIISKFNGELVARTRGTSDVRILDNGHEIDYLINKYPKVFNNELVNSEKVTILAEWTTLSQKIVIRESEEPTLWLTGIVNHEDYSYFSQKRLDELAIEWDLERPIRYKFNTFKEMQKTVEGFQDCEGIVAYSQDGQTLKKFKAIRYLWLHRILAGLENEENIINLFLEQDCPDYSDFYNYFLNTFDFEVAEEIKPIISRIVDAQKECERILAHFKSFVEPLRGLSRKDAAAHIIRAYGPTNRASYVFSILQNKPLDLNAKKKLLFQVLKK